MEQPVEGVLFQSSVYLGAAVLVVPLMVRLGLGSVLGYLCAGILIGPILGLAGTETTDVQHFAEFGVAMMLFLIGLELDPRALWGMRERLIGLGGLQILLTSGLIAAALSVIGLGWPAALTISMALALSSTAIVLQTLTERNLLRSHGGRSVFAVLLTQDIALVPMLALIPLLAALHTGVPGEAVIHAVHDVKGPLTAIIEDLPGWGVTLMTLGVVAAIVFGGHYLTRPLFRFVHAAHLPEMGLFTSLLLVFGIGFLMIGVGLSPALGTFLAGVVLANSEFRHQLEADINPIKGLLLGLFFMTVGARIDVEILAAQPLLILGLTLGLVGLKIAVLLVLTQAFGLRGGDRWLFGLSLAQGGEFAFLIVGFAAQQSVLTADIAQIVLLVIGMSMLLTPLLFIAQDRIARRLAARPGEATPDPIDRHGRVIIAGIGRFGQVVNRLVRNSGVETVVLDADMGTLKTMRRFGVKGFFGDPSRPELLEAAGLSRADVLVVAVDDREAANRIVHHARHHHPDLHIVARARDRVHVYELYQAGANDIVRETFDSAIRVGRYVLENTGFTEYEASKLSQTFYKLDRTAMRDLAELWVPGQPVQNNERYIERARQLDRDLESALIETRDEHRRESAK
jgi:CPA2 family monovalent cation:H+ antiporter-2